MRCCAVSPAAGARCSVRVYPSRPRRVLCQSMGIRGFLDREPEPEPQPELITPVPDDIVVPKSMFGLHPRQMLAMGIAGDDVQRLQQNMTEDSLRASAHYVPAESKLSTSQMGAPTMRRASRGGGNVMMPGSPPPDLASLLLDARIIYIGMPLVASVTELVVAELLWLNYNDPAKLVYLYINSIGSQRDQQSIGFGTEAYAILDTMRYVRPDVSTIAVQQAHGNACMLLAGGKKGQRASLPHAYIKMASPHLNREFGRATDIMGKSQELESDTDIYVRYMTHFTGKEKDEVFEDCQRDRHFTPEEAVEYGIIDKVIEPKSGVQIDAKDYEGALGTMRNQRRRSSGNDGPEAGSA